MSRVLHMGRAFAERSRAVLSGTPYLANRRNLPHLLNRMGLTNVGAEVGVQKGLFSNQILSCWEGQLLYSIDPWADFRGDERYRDPSNVEQEEQDARYRETCERLACYGNRSRILRMTSLAAALTMADDALDFVYIDAMHHYEAVKEDLALWFPKVKVGGLLCGHDYVNRIDDQRDFGTKRAVDEFVAVHQLRLFKTWEELYPSWLCIKCDA
jgi:hypothetical protein